MWTYEQCWHSDAKKRTLLVSQKYDSSAEWGGSFLSPHLTCGVWKSRVEISGWYRRWYRRCKNEIQVYSCHSSSSLSSSYDIITPFQPKIYFCLSWPSGRDPCCGSLKLSQFIINIFVRNTKLAFPRSKRTWTLPVGSDPQLGISGCTILHYTTACNENFLGSSNYTFPPRTAEYSWLLCNALSHSPGVFHKPDNRTL